MNKFAFGFAAAIAAVSSAAFAVDAAKGAAVGRPLEIFVELTADTIKWGLAPEGLPEGAQGALLEGDPGKAGYFAVRLKAPAGYKIAPHTHPGQERVTVLEGTLYLGMGDKWNDAALKAYPAGSYVSLPKGHAHFAFVKDGAVLQLASIGPWGITYVDPNDDPRKGKGASPSR